MKRDGEQHLKEFIRTTGLLSREQIAVIEQQAQDTQSTFYSALLLSQYLPEDAVRKAYAKATNTPFVSLSAHVISEQALLLLPEAFCRTHGVAAYQQVDSKLVVAVLDSDSIEYLSKLRLPFEVVVHLTDRTSIKKALVKYQAWLKKTYTAGVAQLSAAVVPPVSNKVLDILYSAKRLPVIQLVDALLTFALSQKATVIHLEPYKSGLLLRFRISDRLYDALQIPAHAAMCVIARIQVLSKLSLEDNGIQEGNFAFTYAEETDARQEVLVRVITLPVFGAMQQTKIVLSLSKIGKGTNGLLPQSLGLYGEKLQYMLSLIAKQQGMLVFGSEEPEALTELMYTLVDQIIEPTRAIVSIDIHSRQGMRGVSQVHVPARAVAASIEALGRADCDVCMIPQVESSDCAHALLRLSNSGKLVLCGFTAANASEALSFIKDSALENIVSKLFIGGLTAKFLPKLCSVHDMKKLSREEANELEARGARLGHVLLALKRDGFMTPETQWKDLTFGHAKECPECEEGVAGFIGVYEILPATMLLKQKLLLGNDEAITADELTDTELTLLEEGIYKAALGQVSIEDILSSAW